MSNVISIIIIPILFFLIVMLLSSFPIKSKGCNILIGYPIYRRIYSKNDHKFKIKLAKIYRFGHIKTVNGAVRFNECSSSNIFKSYKIIIYVYKVEKKGSNSLVGSHLLNARYRKKNAMNKLEKINKIVTK